MIKMKKIVFLAMLLIALGILGCGQAPSSPAQVADAAESIATAEEPTEPVEVQEEPAEEGWGGKFKELIGMSGPLKYTASYEMTGQGMESSRTDYIDGSTMRMDTASEGMESRVYVLSEGSYVCSKQGAEWSCMGGAKSEDEDASDRYDAAKAYSNVVEQDITFAGTETIAGETGQCYDVSVDIPNVGKSESHVCYTSDGIMLRTESANSDMIATSVSRGSPGSDKFELPAEPTSLEDLRAQYM